jgi:hypothetical protein
LNDPFHAGERIVTPNFEVTILAADGGEPTWLRFGFPASLDSDRYLFLHAGPQGFSPLSIPPVGSRVTLPPAIWPTPQPLAHASSTPRTAASSSNATLHE